MRLLLIRHGQSLGNLDAIIQGDDDPLTDLGRSQAHAVGRALAERDDMTRLYASPLLRARETAEIIGSYIGLSPTLEPGLAEIDAGLAAGMAWDAWTLANPALAQRLASADRSPEDRWEGGESGREFSDRIFAAYDRIVIRHRGSDDVVCVVSHGGPLAWISARVHGDPLERWPHERAVFANCSISELEIDAKGAHTIGLWNYSSHLGVSRDD